MRTTITLDSDVAELVARSMRERGTSFEESVNAALRAALRPVVQPERLETPSFTLGRPLVDITHAVRIAGQLEDDELARKLELGK